MNLTQTQTALAGVRHLAALSKREMLMILAAQVFKNASADLTPAGAAAAIGDSKFLMNASEDDLLALVVGAYVSAAGGSVDTPAEVSAALNEARFLQGLNGRELLAAAAVSYVGSAGSGGGGGGGTPLLEGDGSFAIEEALGFYTYGDVIDHDGNIYNGPLTFNQTYSIPGYDLEYISLVTSLSFPNLLEIDPTLTGNGYFTIRYCAAITSIDAPNVVVIGGGIAIVHNDLLATISFPSLASLGTNSLIVEVNDALTQISLPALTTWRGCSIQSNFALQTVSIPLVNQLIQSLVIGSNNSLTSIDLSSLPIAGGTSDISITSNPSLTTILLGGAPTEDTFSNYDFRNNALSEATVNAILAKYAAATHVTGGGTLKLEGGTNAAPTGQGILDVATIQARGVTVTTN